MDFDVADRLLIRYSVFYRRRWKSGSVVGQYNSYLQIFRSSMTYQESRIAKY